MGSSMTTRLQYALQLLCISVGAAIILSNIVARDNSIRHITLLLPDEHGNID